MLNPSHAVAAVVRDHSECAQVFQRHRIDYCCRGDLSVEHAARDRGVDLSVLLSELQDAIRARSGGGPSPASQLGTAELIDHIVLTHHAFLRRVLPFVTPLAAKVARVHGEHNPRLVTLANLVTDLSTSLTAHLDDEEQALFPALRERRPECAALLSAMHEEHLVVAGLLEAIRYAAEEFTIPAWACASYRALFTELEALERDVFQHVHLENHVLRPRFL